MHFDSLKEDDDRMKWPIQNLATDWPLTSWFTATLWRNKTPELKFYSSTFSKTKSKEKSWGEVLTQKEVKPDYIGTTLMLCYSFRCSFLAEILSIYTHILKSVQGYGDSKEWLPVNITEVVSGKSHAI